MMRKSVQQPADRPETEELLARNPVNRPVVEDAQADRFEVAQMRDREDITTFAQDYRRIDHPAAHGAEKDKSTHPMTKIVQRPHRAVL